VTVLLVALGAAVGAPVRYLVDRAVQARHDSVLPWGTLTVNAVGSLLLGLIAGALAAGGPGRGFAALAGTGFCGGLTTFSTFGYETVRLVEDGSRTAAAVNVAANVVVGLAAVSAGWAAGLTIG
jgi:CrcB protein